MSPATTTPARRRMLDTLRALRRPKVAAMLALGFSSGLPFMLTGSTLGYWLRDEGTSLKAIGFLSWVALAYSFKFLWSPIVDRARIPLLGGLGQRRSWLLLTQLVLGAGLFAMSVIGPKGGLFALGVAALVVAIASATQDISVDAMRIEAADDDSELDQVTSAFQFGYRIAVLCSDALILFFAQHLGWPISYSLMAVLMGVGICAGLLMREPPRAQDAYANLTPLWSFHGVIDAIEGPFISFFRTWGWSALLMLLMIAMYRLPEFVMGPMAAPFYHDLGLSKDLVGTVRLTAGLLGTLAGITVGGVIAIRLGHQRALVAGGVLQAFAIASFALPAIFGADWRLFSVVMFCDNFGVGIAGVALVAYMSSLTKAGYTATQYALLSSIYTWVGKTLKGFSGAWVEAVQHSGHSLMQAYAIYFVLAALAGLPAVAICLWMAARPPASRP